MNVPRLLPLIGVAGAGVLAINALSGARDLPALVSAAKAAAEALPAAAKAKAAKPAPASDTRAETPATAPLPPTPGPIATPPICGPGAADLAKAAGLSPNELQVLQSLQARRGQIDQQSKDLDTQTQLLAAAELKLDAKLKAMGALKDQIQALMGQADQKTQAEVDRLTVVYSKMKPDNAAAVMAQLDDKVRVPVAAAMKPAVLAAILAKMPAADAKKLTELLAHRFSNVQQLADASKAPPPAAPAPAAPAKPDAKAEKPAQSAKAAKTDAATAPEPGDANVDDAPAKKPKPKPVKVAKRAPPKPRYHAPKPKPATDEAKATTGPKPYSEVKEPAPKAAVPASAAKPSR